MAELFVGAAVAIGFYLLVQYTTTRKLTVKWWQWLVTVLGFLYLVFVLEVIVSFLREGTPKAAMVNGAILGFVAIVWAVMLLRFVFTARPVKG
jgi:hypothetical protein